MSIKKSDQAVAFVEVDIDVIVSNLENGKATKAEDLMTLFRWSESQRAHGMSESKRLERFSEFCEKLKAADGSFLPYNTNLPFVAQAVVAWVDAQEDGVTVSWDDVKTVQATVARAIWQTKFVNIPRRKALSVYKAGGEATTVKETIEELCPSKELTFEDMVKAVMGKRALPVFEDLLANGASLDVGEKVETKRDQMLLLMQQCLESHGATVTWTAP